MKNYTAKEVNELIEEGLHVPVTKTVTIYSPGTFTAETNTYETEFEDEIDIVKEAIKKSQTITQRHGAIPYGFRIETFEGTYYLEHCKKTALEDIPDIPDNRILRSNLKNNNYSHMVQTTKGWKFTQPFDKNKDVLVSEIIEL